MDKLRFQCFGSGSSGNCYFIGNASSGILIDAGIGVRTIRKGLRNIGLDFENIWGVFVTHDHADHIKSVGPVGEKHRVPIYSTRLVHEGIQRSYCVTEKLYTSKKYLEKGETVQVGEFSVTSFAVSHDSTDCVGYTVEYKGKRFTFVTDIGYATPEVAEHILQADFLVLEANYDEQMLWNGKYPPHLKSRVASNVGHLSNEQAGRFLAENYHDGIKYVFLCHLSAHNNIPELAYTTVQNHLEEKKIIPGQHFHLHTLERITPSELFVFE